MYESFAFVFFFVNKWEPRKKYVQISSIKHLVKVLPQPHHEHFAPSLLRSQIGSQCHSEHVPLNEILVIEGSADDTHTKYKNIY